MWGEFSRLGLGYTGPNPPDPLTEYHFPLRLLLKVVKIAFSLVCTQRFIPKIIYTR